MSHAPRIVVSRKKEKKKKGVSLHIRIYVFFYRPNFNFKVSHVNFDDSQENIQLF